MNKLIVAYILGILSFVMAMTGVFSLFLSIPGLIFAIQSLKSPAKDIPLPVGYKGKLGRKKISAQPYLSTHYFSYIAVGLNSFSIVVSLFTTAVIIALFTAGTR